MAFLLFLKKVWSRMGWQLRVIAFLLLFIVIGFIYYSCQGNALENELEREKEARSQEGQQRIDDAKTEDNRAAENINAAKNANYSNLSNDELRNRLINAARRK